MVEAWNLEHGELCCRVTWRNDQLFWQISHPRAPGGETQPALVSDLTLHDSPPSGRRLSAPSCPPMPTTHRA